MSTTLKKEQESIIFEPDCDLTETKRNYPSVKDYYEASSTREDIPVTYQPGLSNFSTLNLGDDRIMFTESLMFTEMKKEGPKMTDAQLRNRAKPTHVRQREYVDAVRTIGFDEVERMERIIRDKLRQRSVATSSPFQVRKSFKFFDRFGDNGKLDMYGFINAMEFLGFQYTELQVIAMFARYDTALEGLIDYMYLYNRCMDKNDDVPVVWPKTDHLGVEFVQGQTPEPPKKQNIAAHNFQADEIMTLQRAEIQRIFNMIDRNNKGYVEASEMELLLLALKMNLTPSQLTDVIRATEDGSGRVQFQPFFEWWFLGKF
jgi:Ca2+-binding EF-hand superfamily protein